MSNSEGPGRRLDIGRQTALMASVAIVVQALRERNLPREQRDALIKALQLQDSDTSEDPVAEAGQATAATVAVELTGTRDPMEVARQVSTQLCQIWYVVAEASKTFGMRLSSWSGKCKELGLSDPIQLPEGTNLAREAGQAAVPLGISNIFFFEIGEKDGETYYLVMPSKEGTPFNFQHHFRDMSEHGDRRRKVERVYSPTIIKKRADGEYEMVKKGAIA